METSDIVKWASSKLHSAIVRDIAKDFCDGTVLMELAVLLVKNEGAVSEALDKFTENPGTMSHSLENIRGVLQCLKADGMTFDKEIKPLDVFRGKSEVITELLHSLRLKYDSILPAMNTRAALSKQDITNWAKTVCEHTDSLRKGTEPPRVLSDQSDHDTGFIDPSSNGSTTGEQDESKQEGEKFSSYTGTEIMVLPDPRPQDESYSSIDIIEVDEKLVRADTRIILSHGSNRRACVFVSISMKYEVTDVAARDSFLKQASKNYVLGGCEVPPKELHKLGLGYLNLLVTCSYTRSLRTKSVGIYSPFLLGLQTINIAENKQLFAHVLRSRVQLSVQQKSEHVKVSMKNITKTRIHVVIPEGTVWQQLQLNGDSHMVTRESAVRTLYPEETEIISIPALYLNKQGGKSRGQALSLTPFVFRGPLTDQDKLFSYSDPDEGGYFRFCYDCNGVIYRDMYGISYHKNKPYHLECGPECTKCGLGCLTLHIKEEEKPYCSVECYYLSLPGVQYCTTCGYVLAPTDTQTHRRCPKTCRICDMLCLDYERFPGPVCSQLCQDWDTSKNLICQGCALPIIRKSTSIEIDKMNFHSVNCFKIRTTSPPLIVQRAMVRGKQSEVPELRRLSKLEFEKRSERRRESLRLRKEERERKHKLENVMDCINKIEANSDRKYATQPRKSKSNPSTERTRSLSSGDRNIVEMPNSRKRSNVKQPDNVSTISRRSCGDTGSFLDLLFSSDDEDLVQSRPCRQFNRSQSDRAPKPRRAPVDFEKRKLNRGFPTGQKSLRPPVRQRSRTLSKESNESADTVLISAPNKTSRRLLSLKRSSSKGSTGSTSSSASNPSPIPIMEFERPNLFEQLRCEKQIHPKADDVINYVQRYGRHNSAPSNISSHKRITHPHRNEQAREQNTLQNGRHFKYEVKSRQPLNRDQNGLQHDQRLSNAYTQYERQRMDHGARNSFDDKISPAKETHLVQLHTSDGARRTFSYNKSERSQVNKEKCSPSFHSLFAEERRLKERSPTKQPSSSTDPLLTYMAEKKHTVKPLTDAQLRYERRFSRSRSKSSDTDKRSEPMSISPFSALSSSPEKGYPPELMSPSAKGYSLEIINTTEEDGLWTSPRMDTSHSVETEVQSFQTDLDNTITMPGSTDLMEIGIPEPTVGFRLSAGSEALHSATVEIVSGGALHTSLAMIDLQTRRGSAV